VALRALHIRLHLLPVAIEAAVDGGAMERLARRAQALKFGAEEKSRPPAGARGAPAALSRSQSHTKNSAPNAPHLDQDRDRDN
jgi:hypothetical protein